MKAVTYKNETTQKCFHYKRDNKKDLRLFTTHGTLLSRNSKLAGKTEHYMKHVCFKKMVMAWYNSTKYKQPNLMGYRSKINTQWICSVGHAHCTTPCNLKSFTIFFLNSYCSCVKTEKKEKKERKKKNMASFTQNVPRKEKNKNL